MGILDSEDDRRRKHEADDVDAQLVAALARIRELQTQLYEAWGAIYAIESAAREGDLSWVKKTLERYDTREIHQAPLLKCIARLEAANDEARRLCFASLDAVTENNTLRAEVERLRGVNHRSEQRWEMLLDDKNAGLAEAVEWIRELCEHYDRGQVTTHFSFASWDHLRTFLDKHGGRCPHQVPGYRYDKATDRRATKGAPASGDELLAEAVRLLDRADSDCRASDGRSDDEVSAFLYKHRVTEEIDNA